MGKLASKLKKPDLPEVPGIVHKFDLKHSMRFHFAYHYNFSLHANHMMFLHSYLFGVFLCISTAAKYISEQWSSTNTPMYAAMISVIVIYVFYVALILKLAMSFYRVVDGCDENEPCRSHVSVRASGFRIIVQRCLILAYVLVVGILAAGAVYWSIRSRTGSFKMLLIGLAVILLSFCLQLIGHFSCELFIAKPDVWHGFVAAPILEWVSFLFRVNVLPEMLDVWDEVTRIRSKNMNKRKN